MGDVYKGLTIRIGADATQLKREVSRISSLAKGADTQLRTLGKALKIDPDNIKAAELRIAALGEKAVVSAMQSKRLDKVIGELGKKNVSLGKTVTTIGELAAKTDTAGYDAQRALDRYNELDERLERMHGTYAKIAKDIGQASLLDKKWFTDNTDIDARVAKLKKLNEELVKAGKRTVDINAYRGLHDSWTEALNEKAVRADVVQLEKLKTTQQAYNSEVSGTVRELVKMRAADPYGAMVESAKQARLRIENLGDGIAATRRELEAADTAFKGVPDSVELATRKIRLEQQLMEQLSEQARLYSNLMDEGRSKIKLTARSMGELVSEEARLAASSDEWTTELGKATASVRTTKEELKEAKKVLNSLKAVGADDEAIDKAREDIKRLKGDLTRYREELTRTHDVQSRVFSDLNTTRAERQFREMEGHVEKLTDEYHTLQRAQESYSKTGFMGLMGTPSMSAVRTMALTLSYTVTPAIMMVGHQAIAAADEFDSAFRDMKKTVDGTAEQYDRLRESAMAYSREHATTASDILEIEAIGGQLGLDVDELDRFAAAVSNIGIATNVTVEDASLAIGQLKNIIHDFSDAGVDGYTRFSDVLVHLGNNFPVMEDKILNVTTRIGSMGSIVGMTTPEIMAWATAIGSTGQKAEAAGSNVAKTMQMIEGAVAAGGEKLEGFASVAQMGSDAFASLWEADASEAMLRFIEGLEAIDEAGGSIDATLSNLKINSVRQKQTLEGLAQSTGTLRKALFEADQAWQGNGAAADEAIQKTEGFSGAMQLFRNTAQLLGAEIGDSLTPAIKALTGFLQELEKVLEAMPDGLKSVLVPMVGLGAAAAPAATAINGIVNAFESARTDAKLASDSLAKAASGMENTTKKAGKLRNAIGKLNVSLGRIGIAVTAVTALSTALGFVHESMRESYLSKYTDAVEEQARSIDQLKAKWREYVAAGKEASEEALALKGRLDEETAAFDRQKKTIGDVVNAAGRFTESTQTLESGTDAVIENVESQGAHVAWLVQQYEELSTKEDRSEADKVKLKAVVDELNTSIDGLNITYDKSTDKLDGNTKAVKDNMRAWLDNARVDAVIEKWKQQNELFEESRGTAKDAMDVLGGVFDSFVDVLPGVDSARMAYQDFLDTVGNTSDYMSYDELTAFLDFDTFDEQLRNGTLSVEDFGRAMLSLSGFLETNAREGDDTLLASIEAYGKLGFAVSETELRYESIIDKLAKADAKQKKLNADIEACDRLWTAQHTEIDETVESTEEYSDSLEDVSEGMDQTVVSVAGMEEWVRKYGESIGYAGDELDEFTSGVLERHQQELENQKTAYAALIDSINAYRIAGVALPSILDQSRFSAEQLAEFLTSSGTSLDDFAAKVIEVAELAANPFSRIEQSDEISYESMVGNMLGNAIDVMRWNKAVQTLYSKVGSEAGIAFVDSLVEQGPGNIEAVEELANSDEKLDSAVSTYALTMQQGADSEAATIQAREAAVQKWTSQNTTMEESYQGLVDTVSGGEGEPQYPEGYEETGALASSVAKAYVEAAEQAQVSSQALTGAVDETFAELERRALSFDLASGVAHATVEAGMQALPSASGSAVVTAVTDTGEAASEAYGANLDMTTPTGDEVADAAAAIAGDDGVVSPIAAGAGTMALHAGTAYGDALDLVTPTEGAIAGASGAFSGEEGAASPVATSASGLAGDVNDAYSSGLDLGTATTSAIGTVATAITGDTTAEAAAKTWAGYVETAAKFGIELPDLTTVASLFTDDTASGEAALTWAGIVSGLAVIGVRAPDFDTIVAAFDDDDTVQASASGWTDRVEANGTPDLKTGATAAISGAVGVIDKDTTLGTSLSNLALFGGANFAMTLKGVLTSQDFIDGLKTAGGNAALAVVQGYNEKLITNALESGMSEEEVAGLPLLTDTDVKIHTTITPEDVSYNGEPVDVPVMPSVTDDWLGSATSTGSEITDGIQKELDANPVDATDAIVTPTDTAVEEANTHAMGGARRYMVMYATGINGGSSGVLAAARAATVDPMGTASADAENRAAAGGTATMMRFAHGVANEKGSVLGAMEDAASTVNVLDKGDVAFANGAHLAAQYAAGINSNAGLVTLAADSLAASISARLHFSEPDVGPLHGFHKWMPDFMEGLARGIDANAHLVRESIERVAASMDLSRARRADMRAYMDENGTLADQAASAAAAYRASNSYDNRSSVTYNNSIGSVTLNDDEEINAMFLQLMTAMKRKAAMNVGNIG